MAMSELPSRELAGATLTAVEVKEIVEAWRSGELKTEAEWREAIDYDRVEEILDELCRDWYDMVIREGKTFDFGAAIRAIDAALGVSDE